MSQNPFGAPSPFGAAAGNATNTATPSDSAFRITDGPPKFSFASPGGNSSNAPSSNTGDSVFGQKPGGDAQKPAGSTFGSAFSSTFGSTPGSSAIIGSDFSSKGSFGGGNKSFGSGASFSGGLGSTESSSGGLFGGATTGAASSGTSMLGDPYKASTSSPFSAFGATPKSQNSTPAAEPSSSSSGNTGSSVFGTQPKTDSAADTQSTPAAATTATTPAKPSLFMPSTTPAGAPSTTITESASAPGTSATSLFGGAAAKPASSDSASSLFGSKPSLFGSKQADAGSSATSLFGKKDAPPSSASSVFGAATSSAAPATSSTASPTKTTPDSASSLFGAKVGEKASSSAATESAPAPSSTDASSTSKSMFSMFGGGGTKSKDTPATDEPSAGPSTSAASLFGAKTATDTAAKNGDESKGEAKPANQTTEAIALGMSTTGPMSEMARLKNKTMEDIVTRWASDLTKYQKEFKEQATAVSSWDCNLVNNGEKIQKLYLDTFEAERASHEIERQLAAVESQQEELEAWLNRYESEMQDMFAKQIGPGEQLAGPDQERERTYKLAEKLTRHLDEKSRDLSKMVKEINDISGTLSKGPKTEDALSQIVRVLNGHLTQLQWIDHNASALQAKVTMAQKSHSSLGNHYAGPGTDTAESFYRSYYGRR
ncbi:hypothetical protein E4U58_003985 [Claviceps cyperi]|nr:hypothetical protein E4U58_003985 [Claviceps cyperi]